ncbi:MAG TPA: tRNA uracil 4-sulfurtransferase ThiI [Candidatus Binatia bacterium]|nr:tRNA uracil 4-sulfurtransferase ThiI [Candidatus Binatia bacterium]
MTADVIVAHYNEITLKLGHRSLFVARLLDNVRKALSGLPFGAVSHSTGRVVVELGQADADSVLQRLAVVPGIANILPARRLEPSLEALDHALSEALTSWRPRGTFAVRVRRADKRFPVPSPEVGARLGAAIVAATGARVNLTDPDSAVHVFILRDQILLALERTEGCGGLPVGTAGRVMLLLSGGIDSPVAGLRMQRRGARLEAVHFHSAPMLSAASQDKARSLAGVLARGQGSLRLWMVAFGEAQAQIVGSAPRSLRVVLYRRMMMRIAAELGRRGRCGALVTGESLGQVASQTLTNMSVIERASPLSVLRPLVGMDKLEISRYADREGTFEISILPDQDCCSLFVPRHPATAAGLDDVLEAESRLDTAAMLDACLDAAKVEFVEAVWPSISTSIARAALT